jgi:peptidoglycan-N-acetylglucosamine deacetylase
MAVLVGCSVNAASPKAAIDTGSLQAVPGKVVYLTFDDGPTAGYTDQVLADLNAAGAHATFFEVGQRMVGNNSLIERLISAGNVIGTHSWSHPSFWALTQAQAYSEISQPVTWLQDNLGYHATLFRYPYGISSRAGDTVLWSLGLRPEWWNIEPPDWNLGESDAAIINDVMANVKPGYVVALHDGAEGTIGLRGGAHPSYLPTLLAKLKAAGYAFGTLSYTQTYPQAH